MGAEEKSNRSRMEKQKKQATCPAKENKKQICEEPEAIISNILRKRRSKADQLKIWS